MWQMIGDGRWVTGQQPDGSTHFLLAVGGLLLELHVDPDAATLHTYAGEATDPSAPLADAVWQSTTDRPDLVGADADTVWAALAQAGG